jgi:plasmid stabilization system protein ParE
MSYSIIFSERAKKEFTEAWEWYEERVEGLGDRFEAAILKKTDQIALDPTKGIQRNPVFREVLVKVFPYLIIYRIEVKRKLIFIHSIFHTSRNPRKKYSRR